MKKKNEKEDKTSSTNKNNQKQKSQKANGGKTTGGDTQPPVTNVRSTPGRGSANEGTVVSYDEER